MWEISNNGQIISFLYSIILGVIFAIFYDVFRSFRTTKQHTSLLVFFEDIVYFFLISVSTFIFLLAVTAGEIRAYILFGIILGFLSYFFTLSKIILPTFTWVFKIIHIFFSFVSDRFYSLFGKIDYIIIKISKNTLKCFKKGLKKANSLLYTNKK